MSETAQQDRNLSDLDAVLEKGAVSASSALSQWLNRPALVTVCKARLIPLAEAAKVLGPDDRLVAACAMELSGDVPGTILFAFDDTSGLNLADMLLNRSVGSSTTWGDLERSAAMETTNIVGCAFLNELVKGLEPTPRIEPSPPIFQHEFAACLVEFAFMDQAMQSSDVLLIETRFAIESQQSDWSLLLVPGADGRSPLGVKTRKPGPQTMENHL